MQVVVEGRDAIQDLFIEYKQSTSGANMRFDEQVPEVIYFDDWALMRGSGIIEVAETDSIEDKFIFKWVLLSNKNQEGKWESV